MARVERRIEPLEAGDTRPAQARDAVGDRLQTAPKLADEALGVALSAKGGAYPPDVFKHPLEACRVQRDDRERVVEFRWDLVERHRAYRTERLAEDQIGARVAKRTLVEVEGALTAHAGLAHQGVDLAGAGMDRDRRSGHPGQRPDRGREVVIVGDRDEQVHRAQRVDHLRRGGNERYHPHGR